MLMLMDVSNTVELSQALIDAITEGVAHGETQITEAVSKAIDELQEDLDDYRL